MPDDVPSVAMSDFQPPTPPTPPTPIETHPVVNGPSWWKRKVGMPVWALIVIGILFIGAMSATAGNKKSDDDEKSIAPVTATTEDGKSVDTTEEAPAETDATEPETTEKPTTTTERVTTTTAAPVGTRENPVPLGIEIPGGEWNYTVIAYEGGGIDDLLHGFNQFNEAPAPGKMTVRVRYRLKYTGEGSGTAAFVTLNIVGASGTTYGPNDYACCPPEVDRIADQPETFNGGTVEGWIYYQITPEDAMGKLLAFDPNVNYNDVPGGVGFFAVN